MPKKIDREERDRVVSEAAWRVLLRDGIESLSVRNVAAEAGLPPSSLRYTFPTQESVRSHAFSLVLRRTQARIDAFSSGDGDPFSSVERLLAELLPLDETRRAEMEVFLALGAAALTDASLRPALHEIDGAIAEACRRVIDLVAPTSEDAGYETRRLHVLVDGAALHLVRQPVDSDTSWALPLLLQHLRRL